MEPELSKDMLSDPISQLIMTLLVMLFALIAYGKTFPLYDRDNAERLACLIFGVIISLIICGFVKILELVI